MGLNKESRTVESSGDPVAVERIYDFVASVAHEFRSRLAPIPLQMELLRLTARRDNGLNEQTTQVLGLLDLTVSVSLRRASMLLDALRIAGGRIVLRPTTLDLARLAHDAVERSRALAVMSKIEIVTSAPPVLEGDWDRPAIQHILDQLLGHAIDRAEGQMVRLVIEGDGDNCTISVRDSAGQLAPEELRRVLAPWHQADGVATDATCIGLISVRCLCEAMGGTMTIEGHGQSDLVVRARLPLTTKPTAVQT